MKKLIVLFAFLLLALPAQAVSPPDLSDITDAAEGFFFRGFGRSRAVARVNINVNAGFSSARFAVRGFNSSVVVRNRAVFVDRGFSSRVVFSRSAFVSYAPAFSSYSYGAAAFAPSYYEEPVFVPQPAVVFRARAVVGCVGY